MKKKNINFRKEKINFNKGNEKVIQKRIYFVFFISILIFAIDSFLKILSRKISGCFLIFCIQKTINSGAAFSLFEGFSLISIILILVALVVLFLAVFFYFKYSSKSKLIKWALPVVFIGTLSNMLDRITFGYVSDYLVINLPLLKFTTFNVADLANVAGVVLLIVWLARRKS
jgi:signal peptidase II